MTLKCSEWFYQTKSISLFERRITKVQPTNDPLLSCIKKKYFKTQSNYIIHKNNIVGKRRKRDGMKDNAKKKGR